MATHIDVLKDVSYTNQLIDVVKNEFKKVIIENQFYINREYLLVNSKEYDFKPEWNFNPQKCAYEHYDIKELYPIILLVNNISSFLKFHMDYYPKIKIPTIDSIIINIVNVL
jgi:hypothetical protein